jgi:hypothetical protein
MSKVPIEESISIGNLQQLINSPAWVAWLGQVVTNDSLVGAWQVATQGAATRVSVDGFLTVCVTYAVGTATSTIKTDSANPPTVVRSSLTLTSGNTTGTMTCIVRKNDYYLITLGANHTATAFFSPLGAV